MFIVYVITGRDNDCLGIRFSPRDGPNTSGRRSLGDADHVLEEG